MGQIELLERHDNTPHPAPCRCSALLHHFVTPSSLPKIFAEGCFARDFVASLLEGKAKGSFSEIEGGLFEEG